jgi:hypothetical protein
MHTKHVAKNVLIAGGAGAVGLFAGGFANQKSATLQKYPYAVPLLLLLAGGVVLAKGKSAAAMAAGLGIAGGGGVLGLMQYQAQKMAQASAPVQQTAGVGDAGKYGRIGADGRWHRTSAGELGRSEGGAGSLQGRQAQRLLAQQEAMGPGEAGSLQGRGRRSVIDAQGLSDI